LTYQKKEDQINHLHPFSEKIAKIGPADPEIIVLWEIIKKEIKIINASKIYSPSSKFAERADKIW